jgi:fused signal recognition particle receptor
MFDFLRKKIAGWLGKEGSAKKKGKKERSTAKQLKKEKQKKKPVMKIGKGRATAKESPLPVLPSPAAVISSKKAVPVERSPTPETLLETNIPTAEISPEVPEGNFFTRLVKRLATSKITQEQFEEIFMEFELTLLENNVALEAVDKIREHLGQQLVGKEVKKSDAPVFVLTALKDAIRALLVEPPSLFDAIRASPTPYVILFFGINGTGKTTSIAKISYLLKKQNIPCVLAAADTFRAASIEQLKTHASRLSVPIISSSYGADPASVAFDAVAYAKKHACKAVLIDTAGRMYTKENLLKEMEKIVRISKPDLKLFVGESITGNDVIEQARTFNDSVGIDGIILTKADIDEKAGTILSVSHVTKKPIYFLGSGQNYEDLIPFTKKEVLRNLGLE